MNVKELYEAVGADYNDALSRLIDDARIKKYVLKYVDQPELSELEKAIKEKRWEDAFRNAHNIKGVSMNLSLTNLQKPTSDLCELLRGGNPCEDPLPLFEKVKQSHENFFAIVKKLD